MTATVSDLLAGLAGVLAAESVGVYTPSGVYTAGQVGITIGTVPQSPDEVICLSSYAAVEDDSRSNDVLAGVQVRFRGGRDPRTVMDRSGAVLDLFDGMEGRDFGSIHLALMWRQSSVPLGQDENQRWEWSDSYYCRVNWPTRYRNDI